jgi:hypothetical protein
MTTIRVVVYRDGEHWIAQGLEFDISVQANDLETLRSRMSVAIDAEAQAGIEFNGEPFKGIGPAPRHFHDMWDRKKTTFRDSSPLITRQPVTLELAVAA